MASQMTEWIAAVEARHLADLRFAEVARAIRALSSRYVERRSSLGRGGALDGAGKRAAFALFYAPLHLLTVRHVVQELGTPRVAAVVDLGCGTGAAGAAWALEAKGAADVHGVDRSGWAVDEARWTLRRLGLPGTARKADVLAAEPAAGEAVIAAYAVNEQTEVGRGRLRDRLLAASAAGSSVLVVEPLGWRSLPWWPDWTAAFAERGGRADEWRFRDELPPLVARLDRAAGLDHGELTGRSLWLPGRRQRPQA